MLNNNNRQKQQQQSESQRQGKSRRMNPVMPMMPPPRAETKKANNNNVVNIKSANKKNKTSLTQSAAFEKKPEAITAVQEPHPIYSTRLMSGSLQMVFKWAQEKKFKNPPLFETVGELIESCKPMKFASERRFTLRNLQQWHIEDYVGSRSLELECYYYSVNGIILPPIGTVCR